VPGEGGEVPATDEAPGDGSEAPTSEPVPGPTSTPGPTVVVTISPDCSNNTLPMADANGPYTNMMGKGTAIVTLDGSGSSDDGNIVEYAWDFGDGTDPEVSESATVTHGYTAEGSYIVTLTVLDDCGETAVTTTEVTIVGPTPPANGTVTATPVMTSTPVVTVTATPTAPSQPAQATLGFCYLVQPGNTLTGIAYYYGVSLYDLATVNNVTTEYYVKYGQGLFIPSGPVRPGPNAYTAEAGDTLYSIAYQCGVTAYQVAQANNLDINASLSPGQVITIPIGYR
jgi:LysM repeat protein